MFDNTWILFLNSLLFKSDFFDAVVYFFANVLPIILLVLISIYFLYRKKNLLSLFKVGIVVIFSWALAEILKFVFSHNRPFLTIPEITPLFTLGGADSFPSGHATVFAALAVVMFYENKKWGIWFLIATIGIGLARVISGVHYPEDILAGFLIGGLGVVLLYRYIGILQNK